MLYSYLFSIVSQLKALIFVVNVFAPGLLNKSNIRCIMYVGKVCCDSGNTYSLPIIIPQLPYPPKELYVTVYMYGC